MSKLIWRPISDLDTKQCCTYLVRVSGDDFDGYIYHTIYFWPAGVEDFLWFSVDNDDRPISSRELNYYFDESWKPEYMEIPK